MSLLDTITDIYKGKTAALERDEQRDHEINKLILGSALQAERDENLSELASIREQRNLTQQLYLKKIDNMNATIENLNTNFTGLGDEFKTHEGFKMADDMLATSSGDIDKLNEAYSKLSQFEANLNSYRSDIEDVYAKMPSLYEQTKGTVAGPEGIVEYGEMDMLLDNIKRLAASDTTEADPYRMLEFSVPTGKMLPGPDGKIGTADDIEGTKDVWGGDLLRKYYTEEIAPNQQQQQLLAQGAREKLTFEPKKYAQDSFKSVQHVFVLDKDTDKAERIAKLGISEKEFDNLQLLTGGIEHYDVFLDRLEQLSPTKKKEHIDALSKAEPVLQLSFRDLIKYDSEVKLIEGNLKRHEDKQSIITPELLGIMDNFVVTINKLDTKEEVLKEFKNVLDTHSDILGAGNEDARNIFSDLVQDRFPDSEDWFRSKIESLSRTGSKLHSVRDKYINPDDLQGSAEKIYNRLLEFGDFTETDVVDKIYRQGNVSKRIPTFYPGKAMPILKPLQIGSTLPGVDYAEPLPQERDRYTLATALGGGIRGTDSPYYDAKYKEAETVWDEVVADLEDKPFLDFFGLGAFPYKGYTEGQKYEMLKKHFMFKDPSGELWKEQEERMHKKGEAAQKSDIAMDISRGTGNDYHDLIKYLDIIDQYDKNNKPKEAVLSDVERAYQSYLIGVDIGQKSLSFEWFQKMYKLDPSLYADKK